MPTVKKKQSIDVVKQYMDSLKSAKYSLEELGLSNVKKFDNNLKPMEMNILTTPLTFYHGIANRLFGLQNSNAHQMSIDRSLMSIYINLSRSLPSFARVEKVSAVKGSTILPNNNPLSSIIFLSCRYKRKKTDFPQLQFILKW